MSPMSVLNVGGGFTSTHLEEAALLIREAEQDEFPNHEELTLMARALLHRDGLHIGGEHHREASERRGAGVLDQRWVVWVIELFQARRSGRTGHVNGGVAIIEEVGCMPSSCVDGVLSNLCRSRCSVEGLSIAGARGEGLAGVPSNGSPYIFYYNQHQWFCHL